MIARVFAGRPEGLTRDDVLDNVTLYWLTNTAISSARLYWDTAQISTGGGFFDVRGVKIPVAVSAFPDEIYTAPRELGGEGLSQADPLQQARQGRPLRGVGTAAALRRGDARVVQVASQFGVSGQRVRRSVRAAALNDDGLALMPESESCRSRRPRLPAAPGSREKENDMPATPDALAAATVAWRGRPSRYIATKQKGMIAPDAERAMTHAIKAGDRNRLQSATMLSQPNGVTAVIEDAPASLLSARKASVPQTISEVERSLSERQDRDSREVASFVSAQRLSCCAAHRHWSFSDGLHHQHQQPGRHRWCRRQVIERQNETPEFANIQVGASTDGSALGYVLADHIRQSAAEPDGSGIRSGISGDHGGHRGDEQVKVVVFDSAVEGFFLNHSDFLAKLEDLTSIPQGPTGLEAWPDILVRLTRAPVVTIALIRGRATGNGSELALACDMSFASREKALLSQWEVGVGMVAGGGPMARLPRLMGRHAPWKCCSGPTTSGASWRRPMAT